MLITMKLAVVIVIFLKYQCAIAFQREYSLRNTNRDVGLGSCQCNYTEIFTQLPYFIQALGTDERFSFAFQGRKGDPGEMGPMGHQGYPGMEGRKGEQGAQGQRGLPGSSVIYHPNSSASRNYSPDPVKGEIGLPGRKGQKGEPGNPTYTTNLKDGSYIEVKGDKGNIGRRGRKGDIGPPGAPGPHGLSIQGEKGSKGEPAMLPDIELLRGRPGPRGPPGNSYKFDPEILARVIDEQKGRYPILVPVAGPPGNPGLSIVGDKGEPGQSALKVSTINHLTAGLSGTPGTLAFVEKDESLYVRVISGWREVPLGRFIDDKSVYTSPHQSTITEKQGFDASAKHYFSLEKPININQFRTRHKKQRKRIPVANQN